VLQRRFKALQLRVGEQSPSSNCTAAAGVAGNSPGKVPLRFARIHPAAADRILAAGWSELGAHDLQATSR
jgi:hypothetical protein